MKKRSLVKYGGGGTKKPEPKRVPIPVTDPNNFRLRAYNDSNSLYNSSNQERVNNIIKQGFAYDTKNNKIKNNIFSEKDKAEYQKALGVNSKKGLQKIVQSGNNGIRDNAYNGEMDTKAQYELMHGKIAPVASANTYDKQWRKNKYLYETESGYTFGGSEYDKNEKGFRKNPNYGNPFPKDKNGTVIRNFFEIPIYKQAIQPYVLVNKSTIKPTVKTTSKPKPQIAIQQPIVNNAPIIQQPVVTPTVPTYNTPQQIYQGREFMETTGLRPGNYHPEEVQTALANQTAKGKRAFANGGMVQYPDGGTIMKEYKYGGIHIKPENKGKFTATKKATGKSTEELTHSKNPVTRKRAIFAQNAAKWHHADGGILGETTTAIPSRTLRKFAPGGTTLPEGNWAGVDPTTGKPTQTNFNNSTTGSNISTGASIAGAVVPMITSMIPDQTVRDSEGNSVGQKVGTGKAIASGAASGAAAGAMLGPWGALAGAGVGAIYGGISNSMANNKIDAEMKQANSRISNRKLDNRMTTNNNAFATQDYNNNDMVYATGGMVVDQHMDDPNAELELNETFQEPSGQVGMVDGPSHDNGGVEVNLEEGTRIWSDRLKHNGKTFANLTRPIVNKIEKLEKASPTDYNSRFKQNSKMLLNKQLDHLFEVQETNKQQDEMKRSLKNGVVNDRGNYHYAMGGYIPKYWDGSKIGDKNLDLYSQQVQQPTQYGMDQTYPTYDPQSYQTPERISSRNYGPIGPITEQQMLNQKEAGTAWFNNLGNRFEGDPGASTREWLNKKTVDFTAHPVQKTPKVVVPKRNWFKDNANTMGQLSTLGATLAAQNANVNKMPAPRSIGNVNFQNQIVNPKYMDLSAERAAINRANMGAMDESQRQFGNSATAQAFKNKARLNQLEGLGKSYQTQENTNATIYNQFAGMQSEAGIKQAMANIDIDRQNAENWYGDKAMRLSNKNAAIATAGHGVGEIFGNNATYANELEKANILANQHEGTVLADMYKNNPRLFNDAYKAGHISPYDYARITGQQPEIVPPTPPTPPTIPPPTTTPPQIGPPQKAYGGIIKRRKLKR